MDTRQILHTVQHVRERRVVICVMLIDCLGIKQCSRVTYGSVCYYSTVTCCGAV